MSWLQAILIGLMSCTAASTIACLGTTVEIGRAHV